MLARNKMDKPSRERSYLMTRNSFANERTAAEQKCSIIDHTFTNMLDGAWTPQAAKALDQSHPHHSRSFPATRQITLWLLLPRRRVLAFHMWDILMNICLPFSSHIEEHFSCKTLHWRKPAWKSTASLALIHQLDLGGSWRASYLSGSPTSLNIHGAASSLF